VKLRYADVPIFLEPMQVIAGYQLQSTTNGNVGMGNSNAAQIGPFTINGGVSGGSSYTDRPTVIYSPLTGTDFLKRLMTPIPPSSVMFLLQAGYSADRVMAVMVDSINELNNRSTRLNRAADPEYERLVQLLREGQLAGSIQFRIERPKDGPESALILFGSTKDSEMIAKAQEVRRLLRLNPNAQKINVFYGAYAGKGDEIDMATRSMLQIMLECAAFVQVPEDDLARGKAPRSRAGPDDPHWMNIMSGVERPADAHVAVQYNGRWFWIPDDDLRSKAMFGVVILLFSIADTGVKGAAPIVTVPAQ
jgi:hypothetical protein